MRLRRRLRMRIDRALRIAGGFAVSVLALGALAVLAHAAASRLEIDTAPRIAAPAPGGSQVVAAARHLFGLRAAMRDGAYGDVFATPLKRRREEAFLRGAERAARHALATLTARRGARDPLWAEAQEALAAPGADENATSLDALERLAAALARRQIVLQPAAQALARQAALDCRFTAVQLAAAAAHGRTLQDAETYFSTARGEAYGWLIVIRALAAETEYADQRTTLEAALGPLEAAAGYAPLFVRHGALDSAFTPNHLAVLALFMGQAGDDLRVAAGGESLAERDGFTQHPAP